jgi:hypothetical protein
MVRQLKGVEALPDARVLQLLPGNAQDDDGAEAPRA